MSVEVSNKSSYCMHNQEAERMNVGSQHTVHFYLVEDLSL